MGRVNDYRRTLRKALTVIEKARVTCDCAKYDREQVHSERCAIMQRAVVHKEAAELGIRHWRSSKQAIREAPSWES